MVIADPLEEFARWYLRLNAYFIVDNFIVHAGEDPSRITTKGLVGNYTEVDLLGLRMPHSREISGALYIANHGPLLGNISQKPDAIIVEVKSGSRNKPNRAWRHPENGDAARYVVRYFGFHSTEADIGQVAASLLDKCRDRGPPNPHGAKTPFRLKLAICAPTPRLGGSAGGPSRDWLVEGPRGQTAIRRYKKQAITVACSLPCQRIDT